MLYLKPFHKAGLFILLSLPLLFLFQNCGNRTQFAQGNSLASGSNFCFSNPGDPICAQVGITPVDPDETSQPLTCLYNNTHYNDGDSIETYQNSTVPHGSDCVGATRTCNNGVWVGPGSSYLFSSCSQDTPASCVLFGEELKHGDRRQVFQNSSVLYGNTCVSEESECNNGVLSSDFPYSSCTVGEPLDCLFNGKQIKHGDYIEAFKVIGMTQSVPGSPICASEKRQCLNGTFTGNYELSSCEQNAESSCEFNGRRVAHGEKVKAFKSSSPYTKHVAKGAPSCDDEIRECNNGVLSGSYEYASCDNGPASCLFNGKVVSDGEVVVAANIETAHYNSDEKCKYEKRICNNGELSGSYQYESCAVETPPIILPPNPQSAPYCVAQVNPAGQNPGNFLPQFIRNGSAFLTQWNPNTPENVWFIVVHNSIDSTGEDTKTLNKFYTTGKASDNPSKKCEAVSLTCINFNISLSQVWSECIQDVD